MAKIQETIFVVKLSRIVKDNWTEKDDANTVGFDDLPSTIEQVVTQLVSQDIIVEVEKA